MCPFVALPTDVMFSYVARAILSVYKYEWLYDAFVIIPYNYTLCMYIIIVVEFKSFPTAATTLRNLNLL